MHNTNDDILINYRPDSLQEGNYIADIEAIIENGAYHSDEVSETDDERRTSYVNKLQNHLANGCNDCPEEIQNYWLEIIIAKDLDDDDMVSNKRKKVKGQTGIEDYYERRELSESKIAAINQALVRAFVCCGISFSVIDNPFFQELLYQLRPNYNPPNRKVLSDTLLNQKTARVNKAVKKELENSKNLTIGN